MEDDKKLAKIFGIIVACIGILFCAIRGIIGLINPNICSVIFSENEYTNSINFFYLTIIFSIAIGCFIITEVADRCDAKK